MLSNHTRIALQKFFSSPKLSSSETNEPPKNLMLETTLEPKAEP